MLWNRWYYYFHLIDKNLNINDYKKYFPGCQKLVYDHLVLVSITSAAFRAATSWIISDYNVDCCCHCSLLLNSYIVRCTTFSSTIYFHKGEEQHIACYVCIPCSKSQFHYWWVHIAFNVFCKSLSQNIVSATKHKIIVSQMLSQKYLQNYNMKRMHSPSNTLTNAAQGYDSSYSFTKRQHLA